MYQYIAEANILKELCEPEQESWNVTSHTVVGQACGSEVEKMAAWSLCIVCNRTLKSILWEQFGYPSSDDRTVANRNVAICRICKV